ncbi:MAG: histidinol-phosphate transaminase [Clostridiales bacterium]|nr:histidinol-phosphate transaminase [Clostridiales bacterium]
MKAWKKNIRKVEPYIPGEQPNQSDMIKLNTNENPYPPAPGVQKVLNEFKTDTLRLYPDPTSKELIQAIADFYQVEKEQVFVGVGSDDVLAMAFMTFFNSEDPILFPDITYSFYDVWADLLHIPYECQPLDENFHIVKEHYYKKNGGIIFPNPNAPTAIYENKQFVEDILQNNQDSIVIIDEAYVDFASEGSVLPLLEKYENLLVVQTFSKSRSMAGMRIGFAIGSKRLIQAMSDVRNSFNSYTMSKLALSLGTAAVKDKKYFETCINRIVSTREKTKSQLKELGFSCLDSQANFIFATHNKKPAKEIFEALKERHIYVRYFEKPRINNYLRITIGTNEQMEMFIQALREIVK